MDDFISDAEMAELERRGIAKPGPVLPGSMPDFISDEQMAQLEAQANAPKEYDWVDVVNGVSGQALQGLTFDFADEMGLVDREFQNQFREDYPLSSLGSQFVGGLIPAAGSYVASLATGGAGTPGAVATTARTAATGSKLLNALMTGGKTAGRVVAGMGPAGAASGAGRIAKAAGYGLASGALSGAGAADDGDRLTGALVGGGMGATLGGALGSGMELINKPGYGNSATRKLADMLSDATDDELAAASSKLTQAAADGSPMFTPDAINQAEFTKLSKALLNKPGNRTASNAAITARRAGQADRVENILDILAPEKSSFEAGSKLNMRANEVLDDAAAELAMDAEPIYGRIFREVPEIKADELFDILESAPVESAIKKYRGFPEYKDLPDNSTKLLHTVKSELFEQGDALIAQGNKNRGRLYKNLANDIRERLNERVPGLSEADLMYGEGNQFIKGLEESGLGFLGSKQKFSAQKIGSYLFDSKNVPDEQLDELIKSLGPDGEQMIRSAIRSHISDKIGQKIDAKDVTSVLNRKGVKSRIAKLLGKEDAEKFIGQLDNELGYAKMNNDLTFRSDSAENIGDATPRSLKLIGSLMDGGYDAFRRPFVTAVDGLSYLSNRKVNNGNSDLVEALLDANKGADALSRISKARSKSAQSVSSPERAAILGALLRGGTTIAP